MKIIIAKTIGFCYGVKKAVQLAESAVKKYQPPINTIGPLIHNKIEIDRLKKIGIDYISNITDTNKGTLIIRTHGLPKKMIDELKTKQLVLLDATCPFVKRIQNLVQKLSNTGYYIIIIGEKEHPEIQSVISYVNGQNISIINEENELTEFINTRAQTIAKTTPVAVVGQTTLEQVKFNKIVTRLKQQFPNIEICNTICNASIERQKEAVQLAQQVDLMLVIGGKNSANTRHLVELCKKFVETMSIESEKEINTKFKKYLETKRVNKLGITAGASTPAWLIEKIVTKIKK
jgi:4-hydroxy-3-methylbut-2-enyl diphosphate reductase